jgi:5-methylcytosine-specific restriction endonuclease McrA
MKGLEWGRLYEEYHSKPYSPDELSKRVQVLYGDGYVKNRRGIWEFVLGDSKDYKLLDIRIFDEPTKKSTYAKQTKAAEAKGESNCPLCSEGHEANKVKVWKFEEMDADHVSPWSKGGATAPENCQMLCKTHNRSKGNK